MNMRLDLKPHSPRWWWWMKMCKNVFIFAENVRPVRRNRRTRVSWLRWRGWFRIEPSDHDHWGNCFAFFLAESNLIYKLVVISKPSIAGWYIKLNCRWRPLTSPAIRTSAHKPESSGMLHWTASLVFLSSQHELTNTIFGGVCHSLNLGGWAMYWGRAKVRLD